MSAVSAMKESIIDGLGESSQDYILALELQRQNIHLRKMLKLDERATINQDKLIQQEIELLKDRNKNPKKPKQSPILRRLQTL